MNLQSEINLPELIPFNNNGKWGYCNKNKEILIDCIYDEVGFPYKDLVPVSKDSKIGIIDLHGNQIIPFKYDRITTREKQFILGINYFNYNEGLLPVFKDYKFGFIDEENELVIPIIYDDVHHFSEGYTGVKKSNKWHFIDKNGIIARKFYYDSIHSFQNGLAIGYINPNADNFDDNTKDRPWWEAQSDVLDCKLKLKLSLPGFLSHNRISDGLIPRSNGNLTDYIDLEGNQVIPQSYSDGKIFSQGLAPVEVFYDTWGYIDKENRTVIDFQYDNAYPFRFSLALVRKNNKYFFIDKEGQRLVNFDFQEAKTFSSTTTSFCINNKWGLINIFGDIVMIPTYDDIYPFYNGEAVVRDKDKYGIINTKGELVIPITYDSINYHNYSSEFFQDKISISYAYSKGIAFVSHNNRYGYIDLFGNKYW